MKCARTLGLSTLLLMAAIGLAACVGGDQRPGGSGGTGGAGGADGSGGSKAAPLTEAQTAHLRAMVEGFVTSQAYPNLAIGVVVGNELAWHAGFGVGASPGKLPDADTIFRAGSVTKLATATALLALVEDGKLSLEDGAATWLPEAEAVLAPEGRPAITLRHLLSHSSGLPGNGSLDWTRPGASITEADILAALEGVELSFDPGTSHAYSNLGAALAGLVVSRASGVSYRSFVQARVLDPLGMGASVWDVPARGLAPGHLPASRGGYERAPATWRMGAMEPAGGLFTTVADLARFASHGLGHASILEAATLAESQTEVRDIAGATGYGLGWILTELPDIGTLAWHNGSTADYGAFLGVLPDKDVGVVILIGTGIPGDVAEIESLGIATLAYLVDPKTEIGPRQSTTPPAAVSAVGDRLLVLMSAPTAALVAEAFVPAFFESVPQAQMLAFFEDVTGALGGCSTYETIEDRGLGSFLLHLDCALGELSVEVVAEPSAPHRMAGLMVQVL